MREMGRSPLRAKRAIVDSRDRMVWGELEDGAIVHIDYSPHRGPFRIVPQNETEKNDDRRVEGKTGGD